MSSFDTAVHTIRFLSADAVERAASGHPGTPMALAGIAAEMYAKHLRYIPDDPSWPNRDRFVLSCGHASMLVYSVLHLAGYDLSREELMNFRQLGSKTPGHPEYGHTAGVETTTGPLGQGVGNAVGMALASKMLGARLGTEVIDYRVFAIASDGDLMEGVASEAASLAGQWQLGNLVVVYDDNNITIDGKAEVAFSENVEQRFLSYGWNVERIDGHDQAAVSRAMTSAVNETRRPSLIIAKTHIGIGCPTKQDTSSAHGSPLGAAEIEGAKRAAGWPLEEFVVPAEAKQPFQARVASVRPEYDAWKKRIESLSGEQAKLWQAFTKERVPADAFEQLVAGADDKTDATRSSGSRVEQLAASFVPSMISGSADLNASTKTDIKGAPYVEKGEYGGRNLRFGIREHAMGSIANGLALSGFIPVTSTFLIFSDYMRPPIRLAAMMGLQSIYVFTHDSFFVGEDGPTHQPVEQVGSLRMIPNLDVFRPADMLECAAAWHHALTRPDGPTALCLTRQNLPALKRPSGFTPDTMKRGGYIVREESDPTLVLLATGSEVHVACEAAELMQKDGQRVRVVSLPCVDLFMRQDIDYRQAVLGVGVRRASVEAGATATWGTLVGLDGVSLGLDRFGASGPAKELQEEFQLTGPAVAKRLLAQL